jgi:hypothetical protein
MPRRNPAPAELISGHLTFVLALRGVRLLTEHNELCSFTQPDAQIRHPQWPEGVFCTIKDGSVYIHRPGYEATAAFIGPNNNVQAHADGTFSWVPHHIPDGPTCYFTEHRIVVGVTTPQHPRGGIHQVRSVVPEGAPEHPTTTGVGFGSEPRAPGGTTGWG